MMALSRLSKETRERIFLRKVRHVNPKNRASAPPVIHSLRAYLKNCISSTLPKNTAFSLKNPLFFCSLRPFFLILQFRDPHGVCLFILRYPNNN